MEFNKAVEIEIEKEGGATITRDPDDPGGVTKYGISKRSYPHLDIENLTKEDAIEIYRTDFWDKLFLDDFPPTLRLIVFDSAINQGVAAAAGMLQAVVGTKVDGKIGPQTIAKVEASNLHRVIKLFSTARLNRYRRHPKWKKYGDGWTNRLFDIVFLTFEMEG
jgi:lysozyme family protein